jgi:hypothetical protein
MCQFDECVHRIGRYVELSCNLVDSSALATHLEVPGIGLREKRRVVLHRNTFPEGWERLMSMDYSFLPSEGAKSNRCDVAIPHLTTAPKLRLSPELIVVLLRSWPVQESLDTLTDLLTRSDFHTGLITGLVALGVLFALTRFEAGVFAGWGLILTSAGLVGIHFHIGRRLSLILALLILGAGGWLLDRFASHPDRRILQVLAWVVIVLGGVLFSTRSGLPDIAWVRISAPMVVVLGGVTLRQWTNYEAAKYVGPLFAITAFGIWTTVPDTESARVLLGAAVPMAFGTLPPVGARVHGPGAFPLSGLAIWVVAFGGEPRPASLIGGWACLGILVALPLLLRKRTSSGIKIWMMVVGHAVIVLLASRVVGLQDSLVVALVGLGILMAVLTAIGVALSSPRTKNIPE